MTESEKIDKFIETARSMIGAKWRHRGRKPWAVDCVGLVILSLASVDFPVKDKNDYSRFPWQDGLRDALVSHFGEPVSDIKRGDVVLMKFDNSPEPPSTVFFAPGPVLMMSAPDVATTVLLPAPGSMVAPSAFVLADF